MKQIVSESTGPWIILAADLPQKGHNIAGIQQSKFARSVDGGVAWQVFDPEHFPDGADIKWLPKRKTMLDTPLDFANPGFALRVFDMESCCAEVSAADGPRHASCKSEFRAADARMPRRGTGRTSGKGT